MDFDDGSKTTAYVNGASTQITPVENGGGTVKLVPGATSPGSVLTTTPASMNATTMPRAYYGPISLKTNPSGDYRMFAAVYVPAGGPTLGNPQETRLMAFSFVKSGTQKQIAVWVAALTNNKLALEYSQVDGSNTPDFQSVEFANPTAGALFALDVHLKAGKPCELRVVQNSTETVVASITNVTPLFGEGDVQSASFGQVVYPTMPSVAALFDDVVIP